MAKTAEAIAEWPLLSEEYAFVAGLAGKSEKVADQILQTFLEGGAIGTDGRERYRFWRLEGRLPGRAPHPHSPTFWRSDPKRGIRSEISYQHSSARWTGPVQYDARTMSKEKIAFEWEAFGRPIGPADYRVTLIRLHHETLLAMLRAVGLLQPVPSPAPATTSTPSQSSSSSTPPLLPTNVPCKTWIESADEVYPQLADERDAEYTTRLEGIAKRWTLKTLRNRLREYRNGKGQQLHPRTAPKQPPKQLPKHRPNRPKV
jgi:hypothetical protein